MKNNLAKSMCSHSDDLKLPRVYFSTTSANPEVQFCLGNVSSQLDKLFPKEDIFTNAGAMATESIKMDNFKNISY